MVQEAHRAGTFKKPNKPHKTGRHRSKGSISNDARGILFYDNTTKCHTSKSYFQFIPMLQTNKT